jgi:CBS domain-containing protein
MQGQFLAGILTERDIMRAAAAGADFATSVVADWMTPDPQSASPQTSVADAAQIMLLNGFRHLPVMEGRTVCGVVSLRDLFSVGIRRPVSGKPAALS